LARIERSQQSYEHGHPQASRCPNMMMTMPSIARKADPQKALAPQAT
jgi:hypothetical protein